MLLCPAMGLSPTILRQQHRQEPTDKVLREKGEKKKKDEEGELCSGVWRNGRGKMEERRIKKKRERVRVWRRKKEGKKRKKNGKKFRVWRIKKEGKKRRKKEEGNVITIFSQFFHNKF